MKHSGLFVFHICAGWSGGAKVLGKLSIPGQPTNFCIIVGQWPIALADGGCLDIFFSRLYSPQ